MITAQAIETFESFWRRRGTYHADLTYGQALAQFVKCEIDHPDALFLATSPYPLVKAWIEEKINANKKIEEKADDGASNKTALSNTNKTS